MIEPCQHFQFYCQHVLPLVYDNSLSYYEVLCKLGDYIKELSKSQDAVWEFVKGIDDVSKEWPEFQEQINQTLAEYQTTYQQALVQYETDWDEWKKQNAQLQSQFIQQVQAEMQDMSNTIDAIKSGAYLDLYLDGIKKYIDNNVQQLVAGIVKYVTFGLNTNGHFVAYIPESWDFIKFSTITDPTSPLYKHLVLSW